MCGGPGGFYLHPIRGEAVGLHAARDNPSAPLWVLNTASLQAHTHCARITPLFPSRVPIAPLALLAVGSFSSLAAVALAYSGSPRTFSRWPARSAHQSPHEQSPPSVPISALRYPSLLVCSFTRVSSLPRRADRKRLIANMAANFGRAPLIASAVVLPSSRRLW